MVSMITFYSDNPSSKPLESTVFYVKLFEKAENKTKKIPREAHQNHFAIYYTFVFVSMFH